MLLFRNVFRTYQAEATLIVNYREICILIISVPSAFLPEKLIF